MSAAATSAAGSIQVEVQDEQRRPLDGFALADMAPWYADALLRHSLSAQCAFPFLAGFWARVETPP